MTRINVPERDCVIGYGELIPTDLLLLDYERLYKQKFIVTKEEFEALDKSICFSCRAW